MLEELWVWLWQSSPRNVVVTVNCALLAGEMRCGTGKGDQVGGYEISDFGDRIFSLNRQRLSACLRMAVQGRKRWREL